MMRCLVCSAGGEMVGVVHRTVWYTIMRFSILGFYFFFYFKKKIQKKFTFSSSCIAFIWNRLHNFAVCAWTKSLGLIAYVLFWVYPKFSIPSPEIKFPPSLSIFHLKFKSKISMATPSLIDVDEGMSKYIHSSRLVLVSAIQARPRIGSWE